MKVFISNNLRFFLFSNEGGYELFRNDVLIWNKNFGSSRVFAAGVNNLGDVIFLIDGEIKIIKNDNHSEMLKIDLCRLRSSGEISSVIMNNEATRIIIECNLELKNALTGRKYITVEIYLLDLTSGALNNIFKTDIYTEEESLTWSISENFNNFVASKSVNRISFFENEIYISNNYVEKIETINCNLPVSDIMISNNAVTAFMFDAFNHKELTILQSNLKPVRINVKKESQIIYISKRLVLIYNPFFENVTAYDFFGNKYFDVFMNSITEIGFFFKIFFGKNDTVNLLIYDSRSRKVLNFDIENFPNQVKRWQYVVKNKEIMYKKACNTLNDIRDIDFIKHKKMSREILDSVKEIKKLRENKRKKVTVKKTVFKKKKSS